MLYRTLLALHVVRGPSSSSLLGAGGFSPTAPLAPMVLSQSNVEGNQLKRTLRFTQSCTDGGFSPLGPGTGGCPVLPRSGCGVCRPRQ